MHKVFLKNRLIVIAFFTAFSLAAASGKAAGKNPGDLPVELKFLGHVKNQPMFQLNFSGDAEENKFTITIRDEEGNTIFSENIIGEVFSKKFLLNTDELGDETILVEITGRNSGRKNVYKIDRSTRFIQETAISAVH